MSKKNKDIELWKKWKDSGFYNVQYKKDLMKAIDPIIQYHANKWNVPGLPRSVIVVELKRIAVKDLPAYDPSMGIQLNTYLTNRLKKISRMAYKYQNIGSIPENRITKIDGFKKSKSFLSDKLGREPSAAEIADDLKWPIKEVSRMEKELRSSIVFKEELQGMSFNTKNENDELADLIYYELDATEKAVYEYLLGKHGKPQLNGAEIAQRLNMSPSKVTRIRKSIESKVNRFR